MKIKNVLFPLLLWFPVAAWAADEPANFKISQTRAAVPEITAYLDIRNAEDGFISAIQPNQLDAKIGVNQATISAVTPFDKSGEGVAYIFLVDISKSLKPERFAQIRTALSGWTDGLKEKDRAALLTFGSEVKTIVDFTSDKTALKTKIGELKLTDNNTLLHDALVQAMDLGRRADHDLPGRRVVVMLSDGLDDAAGGRTREEILTRMKDRVPIYAIGFANPPMNPKKDEGLKSLGTFAHVSGGEYLAAGNGPLNDAYATLHKRIQEVLVTRIACPKCEADGRDYPLHLTLTVGTRILTDQQDIRLLQGAPPPPAPAQASQPPLPGTHWSIYAAGGVAVLLLIAAMIWKARRKPPVEPEPVHVEEILPPPIVPLAPQPDWEEALPPARKPGRHVHLTAVSGALRGQEWEVEVTDETVLGRSVNCDVVIEDDDEASSRHCLLSCENGTVFVQDMGSTNGTLVNGVPILVRHALVDGDLILVGRTEVRITIGKEFQ